ncbi:MAG: T9SS type A sorting domain-containing protein [Bacteroidota bacterium]
MKKLLLLFLAISFIGLISKAQNKLLPTFLLKINHTSFQQSGLMFKTGTVYKIAIGTQTSNEIDLCTQPKGIYFIQITDGNNVVNKKIVLQ